MIRYYQRCGGSQTASINNLLLGVRPGTIPAGKSSVATTSKVVGAKEISASTPNTAAFKFTPLTILRQEGGTVRIETPALYTWELSETYPFSSPSIECSSNNLNSVTASLNV